MAKKKQEIEFRYYEVPQNEPLLALTGEKWIQCYGKGIKRLHFHNLMEIGFCHFGSGELVIDADTWRFEGDMFSVIPKNIVHTTNSDENIYGFWEYLFVDADSIIQNSYQDDPLFTKNLIDQINQRGFFMHTDESPEVAKTIQAIFKEMEEKQEFYRDSVEGLLKTLMIQIFRLNSSQVAGVKMVSSKGAMIAQALDYISKHYMEEMKVGTIADVCHISETHFRRIFKDSMNMSVIEYLNLVRIQAACELLKKTSGSMEDIAQTVGFETTSTFNRNFKRIIGLSPYQWKIHPDNYEGKLLNYKISALKGW